ncbi:MAG TPA: ABC transporter substrate-binding protein [Spirochaetia bacterium]|nr:ABC transporter substrate-binding protein [Spirochaetia bacterium]
MKHCTRVVVATIFAVALPALLFAGGSQEKQPAPQTQSATAAAPNGAPEPVTMPIVKSPITLTTFVTFDPTKAGGAIKSYADIEAYKRMAELSNIQMKFIHPPVGQEVQTFNLMVASGQYPDIIEWDWLNYPGGPEKAIQDNLIIKLNDWIKGYAPNLTKTYADYPDAKRQAETDNGTLYDFPFLRTSDKWRVIWGFQIRKSWLEKSGLPLPTTIDQWHTMLTYFKTHDMNGDGQMDSIPFVGRGLPELTPFMGAWGLIYGFYHDGSTVKYGPDQPAFKDFLTTMHQWYSEGLIDPEFISTTQDQMDAKIANGTAGSWYGLLSGELGRMTQLVRKTDPSFTILGAPNPIGPAGKPYDVQSARLQIYPGVGAAISTSDKYVKDTVKYLDYGYSPAGHRLMVFGIEGQSYTLVNGVPEPTAAITNSPKLSRDQALGIYSRGTGSPPATFGDTLYKWRIYLPSQLDAEAQWAKGLTDLILPPVTPTAAEARSFASTMGNVQPYVDGMTAKFILGRESLDNFDKYLATLKQLGIDQAIKVEQSALDRYNTRK